jgi:hypothetical protein
MQGASRSESIRIGARRGLLSAVRFVRSLPRSWRVLNAHQRAAAAGALLLIVSTFGPFSFVEAGVVIVALGVLLLLKMRAEGREFHLPFGDGTVIAAAGLWAGLLIVVRLFDKPLGQVLLALVCAAILVLAGVSERARRPADDLPTEPLPRGPRPRMRRPGGKPPGDPPRPVDPPEFHKPGDAPPDPDEPATGVLPAYEPKTRRKEGEDPEQDSLF